MIWITVIVIYLVIGAIIGLKDSEMVEANIEEAMQSMEDMPLWTKKAATAIGVFLIILVAPIIELGALVRLY